jgi:hypothetical protein
VSKKQNRQAMTQAHNLDCNQIVIIWYSGRQRLMVGQYVAAGAVTRMSGTRPWVSDYWAMNCFVCNILDQRNIVKLVPHHDAKNLVLRTKQRQQQQR